MNQRRIFLAVRFLVDRLRELSVMDPGDLDESITFVKNGKYFSQLANDLEAAEPSLKGVTALSLAATLNRICQGYHEWDQLTQMETGDTSFKSRLLDLAQELYHLEHDFLKLKQRKSELSAEEKGRLEKATKERQNTVMATMMQGLNKSRKKRRHNTGESEEQANINGDQEKDQQHSDDGLDGSNEEDGQHEEDTTFHIVDNQLAAPSLPTSNNSTALTFSSQSSESSRSSISSTPEPPRMYVFDQEAAAASSSSSKRRLVDTSTPAKVSKPRTHRQHGSRTVSISSGTVGMGAELSNLSLNIQKFGEAFQQDKKSTASRIEKLETNMVTMDTKVGTYCSSLGDNQRDISAMVRAMYSEMQLVRTQLASMETATLNSIATVKRDVRTLMDQQEQRQVISSAHFLPVASTIGHPNQYHPQQSSLGHHAPFEPAHQGPFWNK